RRLATRGRRRRSARCGRRHRCHGGSGQSGPGKPGGGEGVEDSAWEPSCALAAIRTPATKAAPVPSRHKTVAAPPVVTLLRLECDEIVSKTAKRGIEGRFVTAVWPGADRPWRGVRGGQRGARRRRGGQACFRYCLRERRSPGSRTASGMKKPPQQRGFLLPSAEGGNRQAPFLMASAGKWLPV